MREIWVSNRNKVSGGADMKVWSAANWVVPIEVYEVYSGGYRPEHYCVAFGAPLAVLKVFAELNELIIAAHYKGGHRVL